MQHAAEAAGDVVPFRTGDVLGRVYWSGGQLRVAIERGQERLDLDWYLWLDVLGFTGNAFTSWAQRHPSELEQLKLQDSIGAAWPSRRPRRRRAD